MKPFIGITAVEDGRKETIGRDSIDAVIQSGGIPVVLTNFALEEDVDSILEKLDGLLLTGGHDVDPTLFGEEPIPGLGTVTPARDRFELAITKKALEVNKPILGICRGCQVLSVAGGGDMYQDIYSQIDRPLLQHSQHAPLAHGSHFVDIEKDSLLHTLMKDEKPKVNSRHHQAVRYVKEPFFISAKSSDGVVEAIESKEHSYVLAVQWHPENMGVAGDEPSKAIFDGFINSCKQ